MKQLSICFLLIFLSNFCICQNTGLFNNGANIVFDSQLGKSSYIIINGSQGHFTNNNGGVINILNSKGQIILDGNWYNNSNNSVFNGWGSIVHFNGSNQIIGGTNSTIFYDVKLAGSGIKTLQIPTSVGGIFPTTGILDLGTRPLILNKNKLTITNPTSSGITRTSGYIVSETDSSINSSIIEWRMNTDVGPHIFPFGKWNGTYIPFTFDKLDPQSSTISISTRPTLNRDNIPYAGLSSVPPVSNMNCNGVDCSESSIIDRWWDINSSVNPLLGGANLTFTYDGIENTLDFAYQTGSLSCQHWNGTTWELKTGSGQGVTTGTGTVFALNVNSFSPYVIIAELVPLDIKIKNLLCKCNDELVIVSWDLVSSDKNPITVERSLDGINYVEATTVIPINSTNTAYIGNIGEIQFYRLKQVDQNGKISYSQVVSCNCKTKDIVKINYFYDYIDISWQDVEGSLQICVVNSIGQQIVSYFHHERSGQHLITTSQLGAGIYLVTVKSDIDLVIKKVLIVK